MGPEWLEGGTAEGKGTWWHSLGNLPDSMDVLDGVADLSS
jgi:hypothetical protein